MILFSFLGLSLVIYIYIFSVKLHNPLVNFGPEDFQLISSLGHHMLYMGFDENCYSFHPFCIRGRLNLSEEIKFAFKTEDVVRCSIFGALIMLMVVNGSQKLLSNT